MTDPQKTEAERIDRILSAADHVLTAVTELSCIGPQGTAARATLLAFVQDLVVIGTRIVRSDEAALGEYESRLGALARRVVEARL
jgi:hypothetical protein